MRTFARIVGWVCGWVFLTWAIAAMIHVPGQQDAGQSFGLGAFFSTLISGFLFSIYYWDYEKKGQK
jgi:uncharacterized membrane protein YraQ (UPF0718 family)